MKKAFPVSVLVFACVMIAFGVYGQDPTGTAIAHGVTWRQHNIPDGPLSYNILKIDLADPRVTIETESGQDKLSAGETVLSSVKREQVPPGADIVAAVNADFWTSTPRLFSPIGLLVADGMIYNMPSKKRSAFVLTKDEQPYIGVITLDVNLEGKAGKFHIDRINSGTGSDDEVVLFTPPYGDGVGPAPGKRFLLTMTGGTEFLPNQAVAVQVESVDSDSTTSLGATKLVLHIPPSKAGSAFLLEGATLTLSATLPEVDGVVASVCGGGPALIQDGALKTATEGHTDNFAKDRHPRTALGFTKDHKTIYLVTVDGRQPRHSVGGTLHELAGYMKNLGCYNAINLDGGGSTTMVVDNKVVNKPSDFKGPRTVASSLLVIVQ